MDGKKHWNWKGDRIGYVSIHSWNNLHYPKSGECLKCGKHGKTVWALIHGRKHERGIRNYQELCQSCHIKYDMNESWAKKSLLALSKTYVHQHPIQPKNCESCQKVFVPTKKVNRFCSNTCAARSRPISAYARPKNNKGQFIKDTLNTP